MIWTTNYALVVAILSAVVCDGRRVNLDRKSLVPAESRSVEIGKKNPEPSQHTVSALTASFAEESLDIVASSDESGTGMPQLYAEAASTLLEASSTAERAQTGLSEMTASEDEPEKRVQEIRSEAASALLTTPAEQLTKPESQGTETSSDGSQNRTQEVHSELASVLAAISAEEPARMKSQGTLTSSDDFKNRAQSERKTISSNESTKPVPGPRSDSGPPLVDTSAGVFEKLELPAAPALFEVAYAEPPESAPSPAIVPQPAVTSPQAPASQLDGRAAPHAPAASEHAAANTLISLVFARGSRIFSQLKAAISPAQMPEASPASGDGLAARARKLFNKVRRDPISLKFLPFVISCILAISIVLCMCRPCFVKLARKFSQGGQDGRQLRNDRFTERGSSLDLAGGHVTLAPVDRRSRPDGLSRSQLSVYFADTEDGFGAGLAPSKRSEERAEADAELLAEIEDLARQTSRTVQKYPKVGPNLFAKSRYVAARPAAEREGANWSKAADPRRIIQRWRSGKLGWWEGEEAMKQGLDPKGSLDLMSIVKVQTYKGDKSALGVAIRYNAPIEKNGMQVSEKILMFPTKRDADEWAYSFWSFLTKLRTRTGDNAFLSRSSMASEKGRQTTILHEDIRCSQSG